MHSAKWIPAIKPPAKSVWLRTCSEEVPLVRARHHASYEPSSAETFSTVRSMTPLAGAARMMQGVNPR